MTASRAMAARAPATPKRPLCFMHVPKSGGTAVHDALSAAVREGRLSDERGDAACAVCGELAQGPREARAAAGSPPYDLAPITRSEVVSGHFYLRTLLRVLPPESIATVLREPRARLLSLYTFWRLSPGYEAWYPYTPHDHAMRPLDEFLVEPTMAPAVDNVACRILLYDRHDPHRDDPRIPPADFISPEHVESLASDAIEQLDRLGFVGVLERGKATWEGLSRFFGVPLQPVRGNVTGSAGVVPDSLPVEDPITERTLQLLDACCAVDAQIYKHALMAEMTEAHAQQLSESAFARQLVLFGDVGGSCATSAQSLAGRLAETESRLAGLEQELSACQDELARHHEWLDSMRGSVSWRITAPLRAAKRRISASR